MRRFASRDVRLLPTSHPVEPGLSSEEGIRAAYHAHGAELYRFALRQLGDDGMASDVVQEVFLRAWRAADRFDPVVASLRVWLFAITRNAVIDEVRRSTARPINLMESDRLAAVGPVDEGFDDTMVKAWLVEEAMRRLSTEHRSAIVETYLRGRSYAEVSAEQGVPTATLRSRVFYGLKALRLAMDEMGVEPC